MPAGEHTPDPAQPLVVADALVARLRARVDGWAYPLSGQYAQEWSVPGWLAGPPLMAVVRAALGGGLDRSDLGRPGWLEEDRRTC